MFVTVIALGSQVGDHIGISLKLTDSILFELHDKSSPFNSTHFMPSYAHKMAIAS